MECIDRSQEFWGRLDQRAVDAPLSTDAARPFARVFALFVLLVCIPYWFVRYDVRGWLRG
ncbi:MAG: hypothetical protein ABEJ05_08150 [Haloglomus sp.]